MFLRLLGWVVPVLLFCQRMRDRNGNRGGKCIFCKRFRLPCQFTMSFTRVGAYPYYQRGRLRIRPGRYSRGNRQSVEKENLNSPCAMIHTISRNAAIMIITSLSHFFFVQPYVYKWSHQHFTHSLFWILTWIRTKCAYFFRETNSFHFFDIRFSL